MDNQDQTAGSTAGLQAPEVRAAMIAIGDELLSGRTRDANIFCLAGWLTERGIDLCEVRIIPDDVDHIVKTVQALRQTHDYIFTSGGIGPTHDDLTFEAIAKAFHRPLAEHPSARNALEEWYAEKGEPVTPERARMAMMPANAELIENSASGAPGAIVENVYVMAGVPRVFNAMLEALDVKIAHGPLVHSYAVTAIGLPESRLARQIADLQSAIAGVSLGSYPIDGDEKGVTVIARSRDSQLANHARNSVAAAMRALGAEPVMDDIR